MPAVEQVVVLAAVRLAVELELAEAQPVVEPEPVAVLAEEQALVAGSSAAVALVAPVADSLAAVVPAEEPLVASADHPLVDRP